MMDRASIGRVRLAVLAIVTVAATFLVGFKLGGIDRNLAWRLERCISAGSYLPSKSVIENEVIDKYKSSFACVREAEYYALLNEYEIRYSAFHDQQIAYRLTVIAIITIIAAGIVYSGMQLRTASRIAEASSKSFQDERISLQQNQLSIRSTYVGVTILCISLVFFIVFCVLIFKIDEVVRNAGPSNAAISSQGDLVQADTVPPGEEGKGEENQTLIPGVGRLMDESKE